MSKEVDVRSLSDEEKAKAYTAIGRKLDTLEAEYGESVVRWVAKHRHELRVERRRLAEEKKALEARLAEIGAA